MRQNSRMCQTSSFGRGGAFVDVGKRRARAGGGDAWPAAQRRWSTITSMRGLFTLHDMRWVRHDYSDVVVRLSRLNPTEPASAKGDDEAHAKATTKYWVPPAKLSAVKLALSRRLVTFVVVFMLLSAWVAEMKVYLTP